MSVQGKTLTPNGVRAKRWRWRVPPPEYHNIDLAEGLRIFEELPGPTGVLLWQLGRDVNAWAGAPADRRGGLFGADVERRRRAAIEEARREIGEIEPALGALATMTAHAAIADPEVVAHACHRIAGWAEEQGATSAGLAFEQGAALALPESAYAAYRVGRLLRRRADYARAELWLNQAIMLGRQTEDRETQARALSALGSLFVIRGGYPGAERCYTKSVRLARRRGFRALMGDGYHGLFVVCAETQRTEEAQSFVRSAIGCYEHNDARFPVLAHDVALFWLRNGHCRPALRVLLSLLPRIDATRRHHVLSNIGLAAAGIGDRSTFEAHLSEGLDMLKAHALDEAHVRTLLTFAKGASKLGDLTRSKQLAERAIQLAKQLNEQHSRFAAESLVRDLEHATTKGVPETAATLSGADDLAEEIAQSLLLV